VGRIAWAAKAATGLGNSGSTKLWVETVPVSSPNLVRDIAQYSAAACCPGGMF